MPAYAFPELDEPAVGQTAWDRPIVAAGRFRALETMPEPTTALPSAPATVETGRLAPKPAPRVASATVSTLLCLLALISTALAATKLAETHDVFSIADVIPRVASLVATWTALVLLTRRCGGRSVIVAVFAAVVLALVGAYPETWALAGAAVTGATAYGLLGMVITRPAGGVRLIRELLVSGFVGLMGAVVVTGYDVQLRPYRFRVLILGVVLAGGFLLAWRLGHGARSIGRRGGALIFVGVVLLAGSLAYVQAIRSWGSPDLVHNLSDFRSWVSDMIGASPRPVEALVGFPALVWGVSVRRRRRQGWWMCAFGALGAAGVTSSLIQTDTALGEAMLSTAYDLVLGAVIGLIVVLIDRLLTGRPGRRADATRDLDPERPEPARFEPLL